MRIGLDGKVTTSRAEGIGTSACNLVRSCLRTAADHYPQMKFVIFTGPHTCLDGIQRTIGGKQPDRDPTHLQYFSYDSLRKLRQCFFTIEDVIALEGERLAKYSMSLFARNVAFLSRKEIDLV